ncbi:MAG: helix-turn-helix transcriptional regulator [Acidobacteriia bacterium]|nr:helix-turn-helix transcriptional regulator [Terriglobia bacterium]
MAHSKLENYLKTYRKRAGLTQREVAFLLGCENGAQVSRYEKRRRVPPLCAALACEAVFGVPVAELFAGLSERAGKEIQKRLLELRSRLQTKASKGGEARMTAQKLHWFADRHGMTDGNQGTQP